MSSLTAQYPRRRYLSAEERKKEILEVAAPLFFERGYEGAEMAEIASRAGVSRALLHRHFGGKQEILLAIVQAVADVPPASTVHDPSVPLTERISINADAWLDHFETHPNLLAITQFPIGGNVEIGSAIDEVRENIIRRILDNYLDGAPAPEPLWVLMRGYLAMILTVAHEWLWRERATRDQVRVVMVSVLEAMLDETVPTLLATGD